MKRLFNWQVFLGIILIVLSAVVYYIHFLIFRDAHHIFIYLIGDIAFVFIEVLLVVMIIHRFFEYREKRLMLNKLNMAIGVFFNEVGTRLLELFSGFDPELSSITEKLILKNDWTKKDFLYIHKTLKMHSCNIDIAKGDLVEMKRFLSEKRDFLLGLLGNPNLLEHESFTNLLWAVFHLTDELEHRVDVTVLVETDARHIAGDMKRAYKHLLIEWLNYMRHLKNNYPYLFSLAMRTNPFDVNASIEIR